MASSLPYVDWIMDDDFILVEWEGDQGVGVIDSTMCGVEKQSSSKCKDSLQILDLNCEKNGLEFWS